MAKPSARAVPQPLHCSQCGTPLSPDAPDVNLMKIAELLFPGTHTEWLCPSCVSSDDPDEGGAR